MDYINPTREEFIEAYCEVKGEDTPQLRFNAGEAYDKLILAVEKVPIPVYPEEVIYIDKMLELFKITDIGELQDYSVELEFAAQRLLENYQ